MLKGQKGITLISLVVTIVILIILAGVAISLTLSNNGLFNRARDAKNLYTNAADAENDFINSIDEQVNKVLEDKPQA